MGAGRDDVVEGVALYRVVPAKAGTHNPRKQFCG